MSALSAALGGGSEVTYKGKTYKLAAFDFEVRQKFEEYMAREHRAAAIKLMEELPDYLLQKALSALQVDVTVSCFQWGTEAFGKALQSPKHHAHLLWLAFRRAGELVDVETVREMYREIWPEVQAAVDRANARPTSPQAAPATADPPPAPPAG